MRIEDIIKFAEGRILQHFTDHYSESGIKPVLPEFKELTLIRSGLPSWWEARGNVMFAPPDSSLSCLETHPGKDPPSEAIVVLNSIPRLRQLMLWGKDPMVIIGDQVTLNDGSLFCGSNSTIIVGESSRCESFASLNSRNGGMIYIGRDALWASGVTVMTDDMHAIRDSTSGNRLNAFGGTIFTGDHVWIGMQGTLLSGSCIGSNSIVGMRSIVNAVLPPNSLSAGVPARILRTGVTWTHDDLP